MTTRQYTRGYYQSHQRFPKLFPDGDVVAELMFGLFAEDGSHNGEAAIRWHKLSNLQPVPRLEVFEDAWPMLAEVGPDVLPRLAGLTMRRPTAEQVVAYLEECGFVDMTMDVWE